MAGSKYIHLIWSTLLLLVLVTSLAVMPSLTMAQDPPPDRPNPPGDRPDSPPDRSNPPSPGIPESENTGEGGPGIPWAPCSTVYGVVINWGYQNEPGVPVQLNGGSWQMQKITDDNGYYASDCMGIGIGLVNVIVPPGLHPVTTDVALRLGYKASYEVNPGLYSGEVAPSLYLPEMRVDKASLAPGEAVMYTIKVTAPPGGNQKLWDVIITDLLPGELIPVEATSTLGNIEIWGNLLTADIGNLEPGQEVVITLAATVQEDVPIGMAIINRASLIYKGNLAVQTAPVMITVETEAAKAQPGNSPTKDADFSPLYLPETGAEKPY